VLVLRYWEDMSVEEAAAVLGCSAGTVKSQAARGLGALRTLMSQPVTVE
jgi:DNA-directed RNA polymerase specialized sigma24 family protein